MSKYPARATVQVVDRDVAEPPRPDDLARVSAPLTIMLTSEVDEAQRYLRAATGEILLTALGRTIARTLGSGDVSVDIGGSTVLVPCTTVRQASATTALRAVHRMLATAHDRPGGRASADIHFSYLDAEPEPAYRQTLPRGLHALELRVYRTRDMLQMDWWYDTRRLDPYTVEELTEHFPLALIELTSEAAQLVHGAAEDTVDRALSVSGVR
jgi:hypothetical protein